MENKIDGIFKILGNIRRKTTGFPKSWASSREKRQDFQNLGLPHAKNDRISKILGFLTQKTTGFPKSWASSREKASSLQNPVFSSPSLRAKRSNPATHILACFTPFAMTGGTYLACFTPFARPGARFLHCLMQ
ncbi:MAG: hypothetical protein LBB84_00070 [Tannerellaceae bacterium]|jgi:hypothetical protein|nr:hypothetical protein [Tannerellaceae bacterium]